MLAAIVEPGEVVSNYNQHVTSLTQQQNRYCLQLLKKRKAAIHRTILCSYNAYNIIHGTCVTSK
jgi:flagellar biosynthesis chaperone FliJ